MSHDVLQALAIFAAGLAAGTINTVVGSGTLITFPTLLALGYPAVLANVSNNIGLVPGTASGAHGYRAELAGQRRRLIRLGAASLGGGLVGAVLLLVLPAGAFNAIVPALIGIALVMVVFQPRLSKWVASRQRAQAARAADPSGGAGPGGGGFGGSGGDVAGAGPPAGA
ncbi:MAG TPA: TSUP family transporter, partial [Trebonia sp.]|nr:TSUP family transporter [Trebonia sp.]